MDKGMSVINTVDRKGNNLKITVEGVDDQELAHFGGLDLHVKAAKAMIGNTDGMTFPEKHGDIFIAEKVAALYLNEIGEMLRNSYDDPEYLEELTNIELVKDFFNRIHENKEVLEVVEKDNLLISKSRNEDEI
ncbi:hypothetical protein BKP35_16230 [Anaerobacillus arseniciselenatis]|uniref:Uncharacterized protein n=1 Tax=Anaerobacillus arseniciselenatis TaxID=85682 RepID=A0A1S2LAR0_9BACI|nr:hypothetical protein [Anaerobacillus arseniciselenatis]OIJ09404.1 hypothetical protein BKP35_16230 [Anaerobacillus arseniciselenatis]